MATVDLLKEAFDDFGFEVPESIIERCKWMLLLLLFDNERRQYKAMQLNYFRYFRRGFVRHLFNWSEWICGIVYGIQCNSYEWCRTDRFNAWWFWTQRFGQLQIQSQCQLHSQTTTKHQWIQWNRLRRRGQRCYGSVYLYHTKGSTNEFKWIFVWILLCFFWTCLQAQKPVRSRGISTPVSNIRNTQGSMDSPM